MNQPRLFPLVLGVLFLAVTVRGADESPWFVEALTKDGQVEYKVDTGMVTAEKGVIIKYREGEKGETVLIAQRAVLNQNTGEAVADGNVTLQRGDDLWKGEHFEYNFKTHLIASDEFKTGRAPFYVSGFGLTADTTNKTYTAY